jgi:3-dehydroquinate synthase
MSGFSFGALSKSGDRPDFIWETVEVPLGERSYKIFIGPGILTELHEYLKQNPVGNRYLIVTDSNVADLVGEDLLQLLSGAGLPAHLIIFEAGEESKNLATIEDITRKMVRAGADRKSAVIALGGGVAGDMAAFAASIFMRGIDFIQLPTTYLAQVDSSVGGKTGVNLPEGKNLVGTFYQPRAVFADIGTLATLPQSEIRNGLAEVVKYGMIRDPELFSFLEEKWWDVLNLEPHATCHIVKRSCEIKADVVARDELEGGLRRILNFGHTIGHAVEAASGYRIPHGEAVAMGMVAVAKIAASKGIFDQADLERLVSLLERLGLPTRIPEGISRDEIADGLIHDKKAIGGKVFFVLPTGIGETEITTDVSRDEIMAAI